MDESNQCATKIEVDHSFAIIDRNFLACTKDKKQSISCQLTNTAPQLECYGRSNAQESDIDHTGMITCSALLCSQQPQIREMSYSEQFKAFLSNAAYSMKSSLGQRSVRITSDNSIVRLFNEEFRYEESCPSSAQKRFARSYSEIIWFSYRKNFPMIHFGSSHACCSNNQQFSGNCDENECVSSDFGWGCMIRCSQMLLAKALKLHLFDYARVDESIQLTKKIIIHFLDNLARSSKKEVVYSPFGIQNICGHSLMMDYQKKAKQWYTSIQCCVVFQEIIDGQVEFPSLKNSSKKSLKIVNFTDQIIFVKELETAAKSDNSCSLLVMVHMKFGMDSFDEQYMQYFLELTKLPNFIGALTGTGTKAMYIVGTQEDHAILLDPHFVQEATYGEDKLIGDLKTYSNSNPLSVSITALSSDISFGFYIDAASLNNPIQTFVMAILDINSNQTDPLLTVLYDREDENFSCCEDGVIDEKKKEEAEKEGNVGSYIQLNMKESQAQTNGISSKISPKLNSESNINDELDLLDTTMIKGMDQGDKDSFCKINQTSFLRDLEIQINGPNTEAGSCLYLPSMIFPRDSEEGIPRHKLRLRLASNGWEQAQYDEQDVEEKWEYKKKIRADSDFEFLN